MCQVVYTICASLLAVVGCRQNSEDPLYGQLDCAEPFVCENNKRAKIFIYNKLQEIHKPWMIVHLGPIIEFVLLIRGEGRRGRGFRTSSKGSVHLARRMVSHGGNTVQKNACFLCSSGTWAMGREAHTKVRSAANERAWPSAYIVTPYLLCTYGGHLYPCATTPVNF